MSIVTITKQKCHKCLRKPGILSQCKYCDEKFCFNCLQQEIHMCGNLESMKSDKFNILKRKLEYERCVSKKIQSI